MGMSDGSKKIRTKMHVVLEVAAWGIMLGCVWIAVYGVLTLPDSIAVHFALDGMPDRYGSPGSLFVLPLLMIFSLSIVSLVSHFVRPESWNMPFRVEERNRIVVYRKIFSMVYWVELEIALFTFYVQIKSFQQDGTGALTAVIIFMIVLVFTIISFSWWAGVENKR
ncbi:MAG: DUF1648 domain-containing protein [Lachnospiraceae bacterium]|nr:DUF1648 domain-containing protein [Lachnospiraceae bacterium]MDD3614877.1 DUF1648 domain-containing protein [Lachnospiraceae bacterium]